MSNYWTFPERKGRGAGVGGLGGWGVGGGVEDMEFLRVMKKKHVEILAEIPEVY